MKIDWTSECTNSKPGAITGPEKSREVNGHEAVFHKKRLRISRVKHEDDQI
jgi:hypothetical protein